jgi:hypothetical protein
MSLYNLALFAYIFGALGMFIGIGLQWGCRISSAARAVGQVREWSSLIRGAGMIGPVSGVLILVAGIYMAMTAWSLMTPWVIVSLLAMLVMVGIGMGVTARRLRAVGRATLTHAADGDTISQELLSLIHEPTLVVTTRLTGGIAAGIVFLMTIKPGLVASLVVMAVALGLGAIAGIAATRTRERPQGTAAPQNATHIG